MINGLTAVGVGVWCSGQADRENVMSTPGRGGENKPHWGGR